MDSKRSTAAQFFENEEEEEGVDSTSTFDKVVELLNQASLARDAQKVNNLKQVNELIINKDPNLLDNFLDEMLAFQTDKSADVRRVVIGFMEEACKKDSDVLPKVIASLNMLLEDENVGVQKKVILTVSQVYKITLKELSKSVAVTEIMEQVWLYVDKIKNKIIELLDSENDGIRTHAIKFIETVIITLSPRSEESEVPKKSEGDISLDQIPEEHLVLNKKKLEEEGDKLMETLLEFQGSLHISSVNLMTSMGAISNISKQRPEFLHKGIQAFERLHVNLPPTLSKSQVSSVRKNLKIQMLGLLKHQASFDYQAQITTLLTDLGATQNEVMKNMPKMSESRKRKAAQMAAASSQAEFKKPKTEVAKVMDFIGEGMTPMPETKPTRKQEQSATDITAADLIERLTPANVADLVLISMVMLPDTMPVHFQSTYTPIAAAGTDAQVKHLSRLLANQLTAHGLGKGIKDVTQEVMVEKTEVLEEDEQGTSPKHTIATVVGGQTESDKKINPFIAPQIPTSTRRGLYQFRLSNITHALPIEQIDNMTEAAYERIITADRLIMGNAVGNRMKILTGLVAQFGGLMKRELQDYIFADLRHRQELAFAWLYQEYAEYQSLNVIGVGNAKPTIAKYDDCLTRLLMRLLEQPDQKEGLFSRLLLEAPTITPNAVSVLKKYCQDESRVYFGMSTLRDLILKRPAMKDVFTQVLLDFTVHERSEVRNNAIRVTKNLYERDDLRSVIKIFAQITLSHLLKPSPPADLYAYKPKPDVPQAWDEENTRLCLHLYLSLMPGNHAMIHELASIYTDAKPDIKRTILRVLETPVKGMGMDSPELLRLVETCPKGAETLVTRIIHILTDKAIPSPELVERVRDLYHKRVSDVRFLIPVLTGLSKNEVLAALPKLIKLNPVVVKEVFHRLLAGQVGDATYTGPLSPSELLIALHNIDLAKADMKTIIKATSLCFAERSTYTQEVLAVVMQQLMEQTPLPTLLMRTVIQSLAMYPRLLGFVMNILQRLITKQVWKHKKVWEGFVRCCQRTKPQSFQVLLQLSPVNLKSAFEICPDLREPLLTHVKSFTANQVAHISKEFMQVLESGSVEPPVPPVLDAVNAGLQQKEAHDAEKERLYQQKIEQERLKQQRLAEERRRQQGQPQGQTIQTIQSIGSLAKPQVIQTLSRQPQQPIQSVHASQPAPPHRPTTAKSAAPAKKPETPSRTSEPKPEKTATKQTTPKQKTRPASQVDVKVEVSSPSAVEEQTDKMPAESASGNRGVDKETRPSVTPAVAPVKIEPIDTSETVSTPKADEVNAVVETPSAGHVVETQEKPVEEAQSSPVPAVVEQQNVAEESRTTIEPSVVMQEKPAEEPMAVTEETESKVAEEPEAMEVEAAVVKEDEPSASTKEQQTTQEEEVIPPTKSTRGRGRGKASKAKTATAASGSRKSSRTKKS